MSAPPDLEIAQRFWKELTERSPDLGEFSDRELENLLYLFGSIINGSWVDLAVDNDDHSTLAIVRRLPCYPLLEMYLLPKRRNASEVIALKVATALS